MAASDLGGALARTLQSLRAERGWSLDQLAARSGVSKGVLVALEQARSNPNLATLARISDAFGVPVTYLLDVPSEPTVRVTGPAQARTLWHGPRGGTGTIIAATEAPWAAGAGAGRHARRVVRRHACRGDTGNGLGGGGHTDLDRGSTRHQVSRASVALPASLPHAYANEAHRACC